MIKSFSFLFKLILLVLLSSNLYAVTQKQIKAVFLEKFSRLITWPENEDANQVFTVCVLNDTELAEALNKLFETKKFNNKRIHVIELTSKDSVPKCKLLYIGKDTKKIDLVLDSIKGQSILTISDKHIDRNKDIMITMYLTKKKINYIINNKIAIESNVRISHLLLRSANEVLK